MTSGVFWFGLERRSFGGVGGTADSSPALRLDRNDNGGVVSVRVGTTELWWRTRNSGFLPCFAGVTSKAGFSTLTPSGTIWRPAMWVTSLLLRCSMGIWLPSGQARSTVEMGAAT